MHKRWFKQYPPAPQRRPFRVYWSKSLGSPMTLRAGHDFYPAAMIESFTDAGKAKGIGSR
jgi:hypothetical protein